jgi:hypothetical protein
MRRISSQIEALGAIGFILLIGLAAGTIQGAPRLFLGGATTTRLQLLSFLVIGITAVVWWSAAFLLWWIAVRRQQSAIWLVAIQVTFGLILADLLNAALAAVLAAIETHGEFATAFVREPWTFVASNLEFSLFRAPVWLVGAVVAIAMGRSLNGTLRSPSATAIAPTHPEPVTNEC